MTLFRAELFTDFWLATTLLRVLLATLNKHIDFNVSLDSFKRNSLQLHCSKRNYSPIGWLTVMEHRVFTLNWFSDFNVSLSIFKRHLLQLHYFERDLRATFTTRGTGELLVSSCTLGTCHHFSNQRDSIAEPWNRRIQSTRFQPTKLQLDMFARSTPVDWAPRRTVAPRVSPSCSRHLRLSLFASQSLFLLVSLSEQLFSVLLLLSTLSPWATVLFMSSAFLTLTSFCTSAFYAVVSLVVRYELLIDRMPLILFEGCGSLSSLFLWIVTVLFFFWTCEFLFRVFFFFECPVCIAFHVLVWLSLPIVLKLSLKRGLSWEIMRYSSNRKELFLYESYGVCYLGLEEKTELVNYCWNRCTIIMVSQSE